MSFEDDPDAPPQPTRSSPIEWNVDPVSLEPRNDQVSKLTFLRCCVVLSYLVTGCSPALEDFNREKPLGER